MLKRIVMAAVMLAAVSIERAWAQAAPGNPMCQIEETNLQMVERDRKADERIVATMAVQLKTATARLAELEKELAAAKKAAAKPTLEKAAPATPAAE